MDKRNNPYSPGAGLKPAALAGREANIEEFEIAVDRIGRGLSARSQVLYGLRGVGKTVLLRTLSAEAKSKNWITAFIEADTRKDIRASLVPELDSELADLAKPNLKDTIIKKALKTASLFRMNVDSSGAWSFGLDLSEVTGSNAATGKIEVDFSQLMVDLCKVAAKKGTGIALFIDEAQDLSESDLNAISRFVHKSNQETLRFLVVLAGLPNLPGALSQVTSYSERLYNFAEISSLDEASSIMALAAPAEDQGVKWEKQAIETIFKCSSGYPYFIQEFGYSAWNEAPNSPITLADFEKGKLIAQQNLDQGFFQSRWDRATNKQKEYLAAMAVDGDNGSQTSDIAARLNTELAKIGPRRAELIDKGLIYASGHGAVSFTVPLMADFINRQTL